MKDIYGINPSDIYWYQGGVNKPGRFEKFPLQLDKNFPLTVLDTSTTLSELLDNGRLDAIISPEVPLCFNKNNPNIKRLFENFPKIEKEYFQKNWHLSNHACIRHKKRYLLSKPLVS